MDNGGRTVCAKAQHIGKACVALVFAAMLLCGLCVYKDYGFASDMQLNYMRAQMNYKYCSKVIFGRDIPEIPEDYNFKDKRVYANYGAALHTWMVALEDIHHFQQPLNEVTNQRNLCMFLLFYISLFFAYSLFGRLFKSRMLALLGVLMLFLYPRFFSNSFHNIKDLGTVCVWNVALWALHNMLMRGRRAAAVVFFSFACALLTNARIIGVVFIPAALGYMAVEDILLHAKRNERFRAVLQEEDAAILTCRRPWLAYFLIPVLYTGFYIVITPYLWEAPLTRMLETFQTFSHFSLWKGTMVFCGRLITAEQIPWCYIPVWLGISVPLWYLVASGWGYAKILYNIRQGGSRYILPSAVYPAVKLLFSASARCADPHEK